MKEPDPSEATTDESESTWGAVHILKALSADMARLLMVEIRLFRRTLVAMAWLSVMIALLLVVGWLFMAAAMVMALATLEVFNHMGALVTVALANLLFAVVAFWRLRRMMRDLTFPNSRASLATVFTLMQSIVGTVKRRPQEK